MAQRAPDICNTQGNNEVNVDPGSHQTTTDEGFRERSRPYAISGDIRGMQSTDAAMVLHQRTVIGQKRLRFSNLVLR